MESSAWKYVPGNEYCVKVTDGTHDSPKKAECGKPLITSKHIKGDVIDFDTAYLISEHDFNEINKRSKVDQWDVIISMIGAYCGFCFIESNEEIEYAVKNVGLFKAGTEVNAKWLYYYLNSPIGRAHLDSVKSGSTQPYIALGALRNLPILVPKKDEVKEKIVAILDAIDTKIRVNNRINSELEAMAKTLYDYWFVQFDFPDANGNPYKASGGKMVYNLTLKREIPEGWEAKSLSEITPVSNQSVNPANSPTQVFRHYSIPVYDATKTYVLEMGHTIGSNKFTVEESDILVSKLNPWFSRVIFAMDEVDLICSTEFVVWRTPNDSLKNFLYMVAASPLFIAHSTQSATGTSNSHKRVNPGVMMRFCIPFKDEIASALGEKLEPMIKQMVVNQRENTQLAQLRDWLLPMLMNGQVTVE
jgi:type I restriction enzyme S subunit